MTNAAATTGGSWAFRLGAVALGIVAIPFALAMAVGLTGGALQAPLAAVGLLAPLVGLQYLLWGRLLKHVVPAAEERRTEPPESTDVSV